MARAPPRDAVQMCVCALKNIDCKPVVNRRVYYFVSSNCKRTYVAAERPATYLPNKFANGGWWMAPATRLSSSVWNFLFFLFSFSLAISVRTLSLRMQFSHGIAIAKVKSLFIRRTAPNPLAPPRLPFTVYESSDFSLLISRFYGARFINPSKFEFNFMCLPATTRHLAT